MSFALVAALFLDCPNSAFVVNKPESRPEPPTAVTNSDDEWIGRYELSPMFSEREMFRVPFQESLNTAFRTATSRCWVGVKSESEREDEIRRVLELCERERRICITFRILHPSHLLREARLWVTMMPEMRSSEFNGIWVGIDPAERDRFASIAIEFGIEGAIAKIQSPLKYPRERFDWYARPDASVTGFHLVIADDAIVPAAENEQTRSMSEAISAMVQKVPFFELPTIDIQLLEHQHAFDPADFLSTLATELECRVRGDGQLQTMIQL